MAKLAEMAVQCPLWTTTTDQDFLIMASGAEMLIQWSLWTTTKHQDFLVMVRQAETPFQRSHRTNPLSALQAEPKELVARGSLSLKQLITWQCLLLRSTIQPLLGSAASQRSLPLEAATAAGSPLQPAQPLPACCPPRKKLWTSTGRLHQGSRTHALCVISL